MAQASENVSFKKYGVKPVCSGCGRKLERAEPLWFTTIPKPAVYGRECFKEATQ